MRHFIYHVAPQDAIQVSKFADFLGVPRGTLLDRLARDLGFLRMRCVDGTRRWVRESVYWQLVADGEVCWYRQGHVGHEIAYKKRKDN